MNIESTQTAGGAPLTPLRKSEAKLKNYLAIARFDHVTKHIFVIPGMALAELLRGVHSANLALSIILGVVCVVCIASANYVINEYLDRESDRHHPTKSSRAAVQVDLKGSYVYAMWAAFVAIGLISAGLASMTMLAVAAVFAAQGVFYNVKPLRTKDRAYLDVISESINNPLRLMIGWAMIDPTSLPPSSIILSYWAGGAFLMNAKRLSEYRQIVASHGLSLLIAYRRSFAGYSELRLLMMCFLYAMISNFALTVFLIKYRAEYLLIFPVIICLFTYYLALSMQPDSVAQKPENLVREPRLTVLMVLLMVLFVVATFWNFPVIEGLTVQHFIELK